MENLLWIKTKLDSTFGMIMIAHLHKKNDSLLHEKPIYIHGLFCTVDLQVWECLDPAFRAFFFFTHLLLEKSNCLDSVDQNSLLPVFPGLLPCCLEKDSMCVNCVTDLHISRVN